MKIGFGTEALQIFVVKFREIVQMKVIFVKEGHWVDYSTQLPPSTPIPWLHISEPTGFIGWVFNLTFNPLNHQYLKCDFQAYFQLRTVLVFRTLAWGKPPMTLTVVKNTQQFVRYPNRSWKYSQDEKNLCPGHSVSILVEGALSFFYTWHRVQAAPGFESGKF